MMCDDQCENVITAISQQKKNRHRYNIEINGEYAFSVHEDILVKYRLLKGTKFQKEEMQEWLDAEEKNRALQYAFAYLSHRPRTAAQLTTYLSEKGFKAEDAEEIVEKCEQKGYIDDQNYARQWIEERIRLKPRGRYLIKQELLSRGIDVQTIDSQLNEVMTDNEELEQLKQLIRKRIKRPEDWGNPEWNKKTVQYLQRKGFPLEQILRAVRNGKNESFD